MVISVGRDSLVRTLGTRCIHHKTASAKTRDDRARRAMIARFKG